MSQILEKFMGVLRYQYTFLLFLIFRFIIRVNIRIGGNKKQRFSILQGHYGSLLWAVLNPSYK